MPTIRKRGTRWQAQVRIKQQGAIVHEESATFDSERLALLWGEGIEEQFRSGKIKAAQGLTLAEVLKHHRTMIVADGGTLKGKSHMLDCLSDSKMGGMPILEIEGHHIVAWAKAYAKPALPAEPRAPATVLNALMNLRTVYSTARSEMGLKVDVQEVADAIKHLSRQGIAAKSIERERRVSDDELDRICVWHERKQGTTIPLRIIMRLLIALPRRRGEMVSGARWEDYDGTTLKLWDTKDPNVVRNEVVPVPPLARKIISLIPSQKTGFILPHNPNSVSTAIFHACDMLGIEDLHLHDLRHEGISRLFELGLDIPQVAMISGHRSWATLKRYTHLKPKAIVARLVELAHPD